LIAGGSGAATIAGGAGQIIGPDAWYGSIGGGWENQVLGPYGAIPGGHKLYVDANAYSGQYRLRMNAAVKHIRQLYDIWSG
jgi:hypothetical protein